MREDPRYRPSGLRKPQEITRPDQFPKVPQTPEGTRWCWGCRAGVPVDRFDPARPRLEFCLDCSDFPADLD